MRRMFESAALGLLISLVFGSQLDAQAPRPAAATPFAIQSPFLGGVPATDVIGPPDVR